MLINIIHLLLLLLSLDLLITVFLRKSYASSSTLIPFLFLNNMFFSSAPLFCSFYLCCICVYGSRIFTSLSILSYALVRMILLFVLPFIEA
jgi:hypothetical protein